MQKLYFSDKNSQDIINEAVDKVYHKFLNNQHLQPGHEKERGMFITYQKNDYRYKPNKSPNKDIGNYSFMPYIKPTANNHKYTKTFSCRGINFELKFDNARIFGLKDKWEECPNILLDKEAFRQQYASTYIPQYNYYFDIDTFPKIDIFYPKAIDTLYDGLVESMLEVFSHYGEVEQSSSPKVRFQNKYYRVYTITNNLKFKLEIKAMPKFHIINGEFIPDLDVQFRMGQLKTQTEDKPHARSLDDYKKEVFVTFGINYFNFLSKPNYYMTCMTPHGFIRLKKDILNDFIKQVVFHYMFKKYFGINNLEVELSELEDNPMSYFSLVEMMQC